MKILGDSLESRKSVIRKKYELTDETIVHNGRILRRIRALQNFGYVRAGELGGYVQSVANLSQDGYCWISGQAKVYDDAFIYGNVIVDSAVDISGNTQVFGYGHITDRVTIKDNVLIYGNSIISGNANISGNCKLYGFNTIKNIYLQDDVILYGNNNISGVIKISGNSQMCNTTLVFGIT